VKILIVSNFYPPRAVGGAEIVAHRHALELRRRGHEVAVFAGRNPKSNQTGGELTLETVDGIDVHLISIRSLEADRAFYWDAAGRRFRATLAHFRPEIVHFHNLSGLGANLILEARRHGARTICTVHDHWGFCARNTLYRADGHVCEDFEECHFCVSNISDENGKALPMRLRRDFVAKCFSLVDHLVFPSRYLAQAYARAGLAGASAHVQSNGVEIERFDAAPRKAAGAPVQIVFIGYLGAHKGVDLLLRAVDLLLAQNRLAGRWRIVVAGDGHLRARLGKLAEDPDYRDCLKFVGRLEEKEIPALLAESDVALLPSVWPENEPVVMLEAIAAGCAQLASRIGGHPELVAEGQSGLLFESGDVDDLVAKLTAYIDEPELARRHGAFNRMRRASYTQQAAVSAYEEIYQTKPAESRNDDVVVLCDGNWPTLEVAQMFNNFSLFEKKGKLRFILADWADSFLFEQAAAVFCWSEAPSEALLLRAARLKIPLFAPADDGVVQFLEKEGLCGFAYKDAAEAIAALLAIVDPTEYESWRQGHRGTPDLLAFATAALDSGAFTLSAQRPAV
jgi:glycosyltransferase involved in cell wall biosynthesis